MVGPRPHILLMPPLVVSPHGKEAVQLKKSIYIKWINGKGFIRMVT